MKQLRLAVIGAGRLGGFHAQKAAAHPDMDLAAVVDPDPAARNRVAAECQTQPRGIRVGRTVSANRPRARPETK